jgi:peptide/nickel transport system ATP-binding protein
MLDGVTRRYRRRGGTVTALEEVTLTVAPGETVGLVGPSGSGKSTLARLALALERPDTGRVLLEGTDLATLPPSALRQRRRRWSMVFQDTSAAFNPRATVAGVIADPLRIHRIVRPAARAARVAALLAQVELDAGLADRPIRALSGGQRQRVAIARALATGPALIVLDEAVSALDTRLRDRILRLLVDLQRRAGLSYLFISHDLAAVNAVAHRIAVLDRGRIVEAGPSAEVVLAPQSAIARAMVAAVPHLDPNVPLGKLTVEASAGPG